MKRVVGLVLVLAALVGVLCIIYTFTTVRPPFSSSTGNSGALQMTTGRLDEETDTYAIHAQYPQFGIPAIDTQIQKAVQDAADEIRTSPANPPDSAVKQNTLDGTFNKIYAGSDVISAELIFSQYTGGAHPITVLSGMNFDRASGRKLTLDDALKLIGLRVDQVSAQASAQLKTTLGDGFQFPEGANTNPENYSSFVISADSVTFIFQQYQVAAYAAGPQEISFPRK